MDKYLWLEEILADNSLEWARSQNKKTIETFSSDPAFEHLVDRMTEALQTKEKIAFADFINDGYVYNTWYDEKNIQGLVRRSKTTSYKSGNPEWEVLLDLDLLSSSEGEKWVYHGATISPDKKKALIFLSPGGTDADTMREFDLEKKEFVEGGFTLPISKGSASWVNDNELFLERDFGPETLLNQVIPERLEN